jgi:hypothetical protein
MLKSPFIFERDTQPQPWANIRYTVKLAHAVEKAIGGTGKI